ncbi:MAG: BlaI/MecI/CopY family transcriptional regulator [Vulcanimicrobiaceae bacterium]
MHSAAENARRYLGLGPLEYEIMDSIWNHGSWVTVGMILETLNAVAARPHAYSTVKTIFAKLVRKGLLRKRVVGKAHEFAATRARNESEREGVQRIVRPLLNPFNPLFAHFVDEVASDEATLQHFERMLAERRRVRNE